MRQQGQWRQCCVHAGIRAKVKQPTIFSAMLLARYIHCCSHCPRQLHVAVATTITVIVFAAVAVTVVATFAIAVVAAAAVAIILAVRVTAASLFRRCRRFHHLRVDVVASSSPLWPSPSCYRCRVIATVPLCGIVVTVVASFFHCHLHHHLRVIVFAAVPLFRCPVTFVVVVIAVGIIVTITCDIAIAITVTIIVSSLLPTSPQLPVVVVALLMLLSPSPLSWHIEKGAVAAEQNSNQSACVCQRLRVPGTIQAL